MTQPPGIAGLGGIPHAKMMRAIELLGTRVAPVVREEIRKRDVIREISG